MAALSSVLQSGWADCYSWNRRQGMLGPGTLLSRLLVSHVDESYLLQKSHLD
jgi:hypothetical protein